LTRIISKPDDLNFFLLKHADAYAHIRLGNSLQYVTFAQAEACGEPVGAKLQAQAEAFGYIY